MPNSDIQTALTLLLVGMLTVFLILFIVVLTARVIIHITNGMSEKEEVLLVGRAVRAVSKPEVPLRHKQIIDGAIRQLSQKPVHIIKIRKLDMY